MAHDHRPRFGLNAGLRSFTFYWLIQIFTGGPCHLPHMACVSQGSVQEEKDLAVATL